MAKDPGKTDENKSGSASPEGVIEQVIESIETVEKKIEEFFAIHGNDLQTSLDNRPNFRRVK
jgi:hypothetical protein